MGAMGQNDFDHFDLQDVDNSSRYENVSMYAGYNYYGDWNESYAQQFSEDEYCINKYQNESYMNVSCDTILEYSMPLYGYCTPILLLITVTANTMIVLVLSKRNMATPTNCVLMGKCLLD